MRLLILATALSACVPMAGQPAPTPPAIRLVGYGCAGASGPLYAAEEDHFPRCRRIEAVETEER